MGCAASSDPHTGHEYNSLGYHGTHYNHNRHPNNNTGDIKPEPREPTPPPRDPTPPPRDPTPPPREPTPPPREPTPPPREPTPPPREPTPPPREPTPPPREPTPPPKDPTPPPPPPPETQDDDQDEERYTPTEPEFGTDYQPVGMGLHEVHIDFRSSPEDYDWQARPDANPDNMYTDYEFPLEVALPNCNSEHEWKRPVEIRNAPCLFSSGTDRYDIGQGSVGTCWFLSVVSAIADRPKLLRRVIGRDAYRVGQGNYDGIFHCRFWRYGNWDNVYIDDYLPIIYGDRIYGARSATDENEMWVSLLEKAFARLHGSYAAVTGGLAADAYIALTGGVAEQIDIDKMKMSPADLFRRIDIASKSGALMTCTVPDEHDGECGLVGGHAYSLTGAARVGDICLVRVRNPWGKQEWQGPWSDQSPEWNTIPPNSVEQVNKEDGEFYMALDHFLYYFSNVTICNLTPDFDTDGTSDNLNYVACLYGDWCGSNAAGFDNKLGNPKYVVTLGEYSVDDSGLIPFVMQIIQKNKHRKTDKISIRCDLLQVMNDNPDTYVLKELGENTNMYRQELQVTYRFHVQPGRYVIVPSTINAGDEKEFMIRLFTPAPLQDISMLPDSAKIMCGEFKNPTVHSHECEVGIQQKFDGKWIAGTNAGGQVSHRETFATNPQFDIRITCDECVLSVHLLQPMGDDKFPLGMKLFAASDEDNMPVDVDWIYGKYNDAVDDVNGKNGVFIISNEATTAYGLPQGRYMLLLHLDTPEQETEFSIFLRSNQHCDITPHNLC